MDIKVFPIPMQLDTIYALKGEGVILIDAGDPGKMKNFLHGLQKACITPQEIQLIVLTHGHWDHVGSAKEIQELSGAKTLLHKNDIGKWVGSPPPEPPGFHPWARFIINVLNIVTSKTSVTNFELNITVDDEDFSLRDFGIPGTIIYTPGHSSGSISVLLENGKAFVGDLATSKFPMRIGPGLPIFGDDLQTIKNSWRKLLALGAKVVYPAHGKPFPAEYMKKAIA